MSKIKHNWPNKIVKKLKKLLKKLKMKIKKIRMNNRHN